MTPQAAEEQYRTLQRLQVVLVMAARRAWARMTPSNFDRSWAAIAPGLLTVTAATQLAAARAATEYVPAVLAETDQPNDPLARVRPQAFAGTASDGRDLGSLLAGSVRLSKAAVATGRTPEQGLALGGRWLDGAVQTIATDAARDATQAEIAVRPNMGYVRQINPPCCSRCAVLAGRWYRHNDILPRHPRCDCSLIPSLESRADDFTVNPQQLVSRGLVTDLTKGQRQRLEGGADLSRVLNESRDRWRERLAAQRRAEGPVDRIGRRRPEGWMGGGTNPPPAGATIHDLFAKLRADVDRNLVADQLRAAGIAQ